MKRFPVTLLILAGTFILMVQCWNMFKAERLLRAADRHAQTGQAEVAILEFQRALELTPNRYELHRMLGNAALHGYPPHSRNLRLLFLAEAEFRQAAELNPLYPYSWSELADALAMIQRFGGKIESPEKYYRRALEIDPENPRILGGLLAWQLQNDRRAEAWDTFFLLIASDPAALDGYGPFLVRDGADIDRVARRIAGDPVRMLRLARMVYRRGNFERSVSLLRGLPDGHRRPEVASLLALNLRKLKRGAEAEKVLRAALSESPDSLPLARDLGWVLVQEGDPQQGLRVLGEAIAKHPEAVWLVLEAASAARSAGDPAQAADWFQQALDSKKLSDQNRRSALLGLAESEEKAGRLRQSLAAYNIILEMEPDNQELAARVRHLQYQLEEMERSGNR